MHIQTLTNLNNIYTCILPNKKLDKQDKFILSKVLSIKEKIYDMIEKYGKLQSDKHDILAYNKHDISVSTDNYFNDIINIKSECKSTSTDDILAYNKHDISVSTDNYFNDIINIKSKCKSISTDDILISNKHDICVLADDSLNNKSLDDNK